LPDLPTALNDLARDLRLDADLIPLQRRIRRCRAAVAAILDTGLPVRALATELARRGVVNRRDEPISYGHLRVLLSRLEARKPSRGRQRRAALPDLSPQPLRATLTAHTQVPSPTERKRPDFSKGLFKEDPTKTGRS